LYVVCKALLSTGWMAP